MGNFQKYLFVFLIGAGVIVGFSTLAFTKDDIVFPVSELGNCQNETDCRTFCDDPAHRDECLAFAERYNLLSSDEIAKAKKFQEIGTGPGGCTSEQECETYCNNVTHIRECIAFAEEHGLIPPEELEEARRVARALEQGAQLPGGCTNKQACEAYCEDPSHMRECIEFGEAAGFIPPEELREAKQVLKAIEAGVPPPKCRGKAQCDVYCKEPSHMEECFNFAVAAGFIPPEEAKQARKMMSLMAQGKMPGECSKGKEACEAYCAKEENIEECAMFFLEAGFMTPEQAEMFKKTGGKGPGGCKGEEECETFCNNPQNQQACFEFAREHGLISEQDLRNIEEGMRQMKEGIQTAPPEVAQCLKERIGEEVLEKIRGGTFVPNPEIGEHMRSCFEEFMQKQQQMMEQRMQECLGMPCEQAFSCLENMSGGGPQGQQGGGEGQGPGPSGFEQAIQAKMESCMQEQQMQQGPMIPQEYQQFLPENAEGMSPEDVERIIRERAEQQIREQIQEQIGPIPGGEGFEPGQIPQHEEVIERGVERFEQILPNVPEGTELVPQQPQQQAPPAEQVPPQEFQQPSSSELQGNILEAAGGILRQLLFGR